MSHKLTLAMEPYAPEASTLLDSRRKQAVGVNSNSMCSGAISQQLVA